MREKTVLAIAAAIGRAASERLTVGVLVTALFLVLALGGCFRSHGRVEATAAPDAGFMPEPDAGAIVIDAGVNDDLDGDGYPASVDCNDHDASIHPGAPEFACGLDGVDQNCDGWDYGEDCEADPMCIEWLCNG